MKACKKMARDREGRVDSVEGRHLGNCSRFLDCGISVGLEALKTSCKVGSKRPARS